MGKNYTALSNGQCILLRCIFVAIQFYCFTDYALYFARVRPKRGSELPMQQLTGAPEKSFIYLAIFFARCDCFFVFAIDHADQP